MATSAYEYALNLLSARAYTTRNLRRKLTLREYDAEQISAAVERLERAGLLDDEKYAREFARQRLTVGGSSVRRVKQDLQRKGVTAGAIGVAIDDVLEQEAVDVDRSLDAAVRKKLATLRDVDDATRRRRLFAYLARRGFEIEDIQRAIKRIENL